MSSDPEKIMVNLLCACVALEDIETVSDLLKGSIDPNDFDDNGLTALMYAAISGNKDCMELLLREGADKDLKDAKGKTAFNYAKNLGAHMVMERYHQDIKARAQDRAQKETHQHIKKSSYSKARVKKRPLNNN